MLDEGYYILGRLCLLTFSRPPFFECCSLHSSRFLCHPGKITQNKEYAHDHSYQILLQFLRESNRSEIENCAQGVVSWHPGKKRKGVLERVSIAISH